MMKTGLKIFMALGLFASIFLLYGQDDIIIDEFEWVNPDDTGSSEAEKQPAEDTEKAAPAVEEKKDEPAAEGDIVPFDFDDIDFDDSGDTVKDSGKKTESKKDDSFFELKKGEEELLFEESTFEDLEFLDEFEFTEQAFDEEFRAEAATYGFLLNFANEHLDVLQVDQNMNVDLYGVLVEAFKNYYDFSPYKEDELIPRQVFAEFLFSVVADKTGSHEDVPDKVQWAIERGYLNPGGEKDEVDMFDISDLTEGDTGEAGEESLFADEPAEETVEDIKLVNPNRISGAVDIGSVITLKFVPPPTKYGRFKIMKKDASGNYSEAGSVSADDMSFTDADSLAPFKVGMEIVQYQISRTDEDFIVSVTYQQPSGITTEKKITYKIEPDFESVKEDNGEEPKKTESPVIPDFLSAKVDFTGNIQLRWVEEEDSGGPYNVYWKSSEGGEAELIAEGVKTTELNDSLSRQNLNVASVNEYQISRNMNDFIISLSYSDAEGASHEVKYFYKVVREVPKGKKKPTADQLIGKYVSRGEVIDAFNMLGEEVPSKRKRFVDIPVFSTTYRMPASPI